MEVVQKKQSGKGLNWEATFPDEPVGEKSRSFLQRVVFIIASHILRIRDLLPAKCFKKRQIEKWKFYVIRAEGEGGDVVHSLKGVMEAIEFAYLNFWRPPTAIGQAVDIMLQPSMIHSLADFFMQNNVTFKVIIDDVQK
ncbi:Carboxypeptidase activation peptide family protein [Acanthocheilonema viteae]